MPKCRWLLVPMVCCLLAQPVAAVPFVPDFSEGPVVFDFEDGLQGWTANDSVQRVQTQVLGGEWAIFGDGLVPPVEPKPFNNGIWIEMDLTEVGVLSFDQFFAGDATEGTDFVLTLAQAPILENIFVGVLLPMESPDPTANPGLRTVDLTEMEDVRKIGIVWWCLDVIHACPPDDPATFLGFIDNVTLYPIPEPSVLAHLGGGLAVLAGMTRSRKSRGT